MAADVPKIVLTPLERSHHFGRRECVANEVLKVGRSVDRRRISPNNLIFDCRVLSRNHAQIWFENGKFYIKDTKSSNGTFVNENRLSPSGEESGAVELKSRDIVQFGVNVNVDKKVTHGCIIATVKLYLNEVEVPGHEPPVQQVLHIIQTALAREQELENKLASMQGVLNVAKELASESMIAIVKEDELMSRLEMMENQLQIYTRNATEDELKQKLKEAYEEKRTSDLSAKDTIRNILQEKLECLSKLSQLQRDYDRAEEECQKYKMLYDNAKQEHTQEVAKLGTELSKAETERKTIQDKMTEEKQSLVANLESVQAEADFTKEQLDLTKSRLVETKSELVDLKIKVEADRQRNLKRISVGEGSAEEPLSATLLPPGTEEPAVTDLAQGMLSSSTEEDSQSKLPTGSVNNGDPSSKGLVTDAPAEMTLLTMDESRVSPVTPPRLADIDRRETLMPSRSATPSKMERLETELKVARERITDLEEQLLLAAGDRNAIPGPAGVNISGGTDSGRNLEVVRLGSPEISPAAGMGHYSARSNNSWRNPVMSIVRNYAQMIIANSQVIVLQQYLAESKEKVKKLEEHLRLLEPSDGAENTSNLVEKLKEAELECQQVKEENEALKKELEQLQRELDQERSRNEALLAENVVRSAENDALRQRLDEVSAMVNTPGLTRQQQQQQHVKILTILALVSIGVALASWLM